MAYEGGSCRGALRKGGSGVMKGGGSRFPDTNRAPSSYAKWAQRYRGCGAEGALSGAWARCPDSPPLGPHCLPLKKKVRVVTLRLTGRKFLIYGNHVHLHWAVNEASGGVDGTEAGLGFAHGVRGHDSQKAAHG